MKIIHCADIHLDSKLETNLSGEQSKQRRNEILTSFNRMIQYAVSEGVEAIIIAGDLYDKKNISATARNAVRDAITLNPGIDFYYLKGNHDASTILEAFGDLPANLKMFDDSWKSYTLDEAGRIRLYGVELNADNAANISDSLVLDASVFNIVTLHGQTGEYDAKNKAETISLRSLRNKNIDYLALGHVHKYVFEELDARAKYCYPGCLEGRGFDECGAHGFVLIDVDEASLEADYQFVKWASREMHEVEVDISRCMTDTDVLGCVRERLFELAYPAADMIKIVFVGQIDIECDKDENYILSQLTDAYYFIKIKDKTTYRIDYSAYANDATLKGEFIRMVHSRDDISEEEKATIIRYGMQALTGEELK